MLNVMLIFTINPSSPIVGPHSINQEVRLGREVNNFLNKKYNNSAVYLEGGHPYRTERESRVAVESFYKKININERIRIIRADFI